jgi:hypothetical protein
LIGKQQKIKLGVILMLEFNSKKVVGKAVKVVNISENDIETIIVNGMEGGIHYWAGLNNTGIEWEEKPKDEPRSTWTTKLLLEGKEVEFFDIEDESDRWTLTLEKLIQGVQLNINNRPHDCDLEYGDATTSDCIIQYALFGKIVFG